MSAKPVPGNELAVHDTMNQLWRQGATVLHQDIAPVHVSGHGSADELKTVLALVRPDHFLPVHGEMRHLVAHAQLAEEMGVARERIFVTENGACLELAAGVVTRGDNVEAGVVFVDGLGIGDIADVVLRDRRQLSADGVLIIVCQLHPDEDHPEPEVIARGFAPDGAEAGVRAAGRGAAVRGAGAREASPSGRRRSSRRTCTTRSRRSSTSARRSGR